MSLGLVAYGSSDESENSDTEESDKATTESTKTTNLLKDSHSQGSNSHDSDQDSSLKPHLTKVTTEITENDNPENSVKNDPGSLIEDEDDYFLPAPAVPKPELLINAHQPLGGGGLKLPPPKTAVENDEVVHSQTSKDKQTETNVHKPLTGPALIVDAALGSKNLLGLPEPKSEEGSSLTYDDELEDEVKPKTYGEPEIPKPPPKAKKAKQPIKFVIPSLEDLGPEDDEDEPKPKKIKPSEKKPGLFAILPAPKNMSVKTTGRALIPHTVGKKPVTAKPSVPVKQTTKTTKTDPTAKMAALGALKLSGVPDDDSDDDDEGDANFFSLGDATSKPNKGLSASTTDKGNTSLEPSLRGPWLGPASVSSELLGSSPMFPTNAQNKDFTPSIRESEQTANNSSSTAEPFLEGIPLDNDAPLTFNTKVMPQAAAVGPSYIGPTAPQYQQHYASAEEFSYDEQTLPESEGTGGDGGTFMQDEAFLKIMGRHGRGKEAINIIDVNPDDRLAPEDLIKNISEETTERVSYSKKNKDLPSAQQRRKHQITYLAHQAKERELELKNQWASNRMTKKQTQAKYGF